MATGGSSQKTPKETFEFICTSCVEEDLIKEALKYCVDCQRYCCKDCLTSHRRIPVLKGHSFLDNSAVKSQELTKSLPAIPTQQCSEHDGMVMLMYCKDHDIACCCLCASEYHRSCDDMISVSDNIDKLYRKTDTPKTSADINRGLDVMKERQNDSDAFLKQLQESKAKAIIAARNFRREMEQLLKRLEKSSIYEIENRYKKLEKQFLEERKKYEDAINHLKNFKQLLVQASGNVAQQFVCSKIAQQYIKTIETGKITFSSLRHAAVIFQPLEELKTSLNSKTSLGNTTTKLSRSNALYKIDKICQMNVKLQDDTSNCRILGSCIIDDRIMLTDYNNNKLKRFDISSFSLVDYCKVPDMPCGICRVGENVVAVACQEEVQFVSIEYKLLFIRSIKMKHKSYGIAHYSDTLYVTDERKSLYMYDTAGTLLKTVTPDSSGQSLFGVSNHIIFNNKNGRLFVGGGRTGLVCFNDQCDYIKTITGTGLRPDGICMDSYGNVIVACWEFQTIVQCDRDGQKVGIIVDKTNCPPRPRSVCIHPRLKQMLVGSLSNTVQVYYLC